MSFIPHRGRAAWLLLAALCATASARADGPRGAGVPLLPKYAQECASCHVAYPPQLLPAPSWARLLSDLPHHFGTDASVDPQTLTELSTWLTAHAGSNRRSAEPPPQDRITRTAWFVREHREVPAGAWQRTAIKSPANCAACHTQAEQGNFDEHDVRIPR